jgi:transcription-repair coupling factor (superfamily II helicase)
MITLLINQLRSLFRAYPPWLQTLKQVHEQQWPLALEGVQAGLLAFLSAEIQQSLSGSHLIVLPSEQEAAALAQDLSLFSQREALLFPGWGTLPYRGGHPLPSVFGERARLLSRLLAGDELLVVASLKTFLSLLPDPDHLRSLTLSVNLNDRLDHFQLARTLQEYGYLRVPRVSLKGEVALRGEVIDIYPYGVEDAVRILLDFDKVADIRRFNPVTQASTAHLEKLNLAPSREVVFDRSIMETLAGSLEDPRAADLVADLTARIEEGRDCPGLEYLFPLCFPDRFTLLDYLGSEALLFLVDPSRLAADAKSIRKEYQELYTRARREAASADAGAEIGLQPRPAQILSAFEPLRESHERTVSFHYLKAGRGEPERIRFRSDPPRSFFGNIAFLSEELGHLSSLGYRIYIFAVYEHQAERIRGLLGDLPAEIFPASISGGFSLPEMGLMVIQENEIFGRKKRIPRSLGTGKTRPIDSFVELNPGDYVVHINHGIGRFHGIERMRAAGNERDYIHLEYAQAEKIYVPIEQVNLIQRYIGQEGSSLRLDRLGGRGWESKKARVKRSVEDLARRLVLLYSRRSQEAGFSFPADSDWQSAFEAGFPYEETEDQLECIREVKHDMESSRPMDRLICGDVGYGKTEVALRAAFKAVMGGKQVAYLAPTTILVEQHFETFGERFERFPVELAMLSRFRNRREQKQILKQLDQGGVDIVIGTHRLLQRDVKFKNLGLLIIDEEQRFGVKDKEKLKELKTSVDCLTLTATPIPRTLHMSLMKIRDMSVINTPPQNRLPIETFIQEFSDDLVARAVRQEIQRGGQVYYLHNRVQSLPHVHSFITRLVPEASVATAHGQMREDELEEVMHRFIRGDMHVLLSTTIIENGLDIPNVNTIIIDRADMFGISQLYQLRGRVGRSDQAAYAYLLYPEGRAITELAMKRLRIISDFTELGSGFKIALKDLEIRGAGNLLGSQQHGDILAVGLDMYLRLLDEAIGELGGEVEGGGEAPEVYLELEYTGYIPDTYIEEAMEKMEVYKKIAAIVSEEELAAVQRELEDRFGPPPAEVMSVFAIAEIRVLCRRLHISELKERAGQVSIAFQKVSELSVDKVLTLISESSGKVSLDARKPNCLLLKTGKLRLTDKPEFISETLARLL